MKRFQMLLVPLLAMPLFIGCKKEAYRVVFSMSHCSMKDEQGVIHSWEEGMYTMLTSKEKTITGEFIVDDGYKFSEGSVLFYNADTKEEITEGCSFDLTTNKFSIKITVSIRVNASADPAQP